MLTILNGRVSPKNIVLVDQRNPYGRDKVYMPTALVVVAAQLIAAGHKVHMVDFNIDRYEDENIQKLLAHADIICVSAVGAPYIPQTITMCERLSDDFLAQIVAGGQVVESFSQRQFQRMFGRSGAIKAGSVKELPSLFGECPEPYDVDLRQVYEEMGDERLRQYLSTEFCLFFSQGCAFGCTYCSAPKNRQEHFHRLDLFRANFEYLVVKAKSFGFKSMECYASSLDFFQNPLVVAEYMRAIWKVCTDEKFTFHLRALTCMKTFLKAQEVLPDFEELVKGCGLGCLGAGIDGSGEAQWKRYKKSQNHTADIPRWLAACDKLSIRTEVLIFMGDPDSKIGEIWNAVKNSFLYALWPMVILRPHMAKIFLPGNDGWKKQPELAHKMITEPSLFYNLDVCALASQITHPNLLNRWMVNFCYMFIMALALVGKNATALIFPQGGKGILAKLAKTGNRFMPFDR